MKQIAAIVILQPTQGHGFSNETVSYSSIPSKCLIIHALGTLIMDERVYNGDDAQMSWEIGYLQARDHFFLSRLSEVEARAAAAERELRAVSNGVERLDSHLRVGAGRIHGIF